MHELAKIPIPEKPTTEELAKGPDGPGAPQVHRDSNMSSDASPKVNQGKVNEENKFFTRQTQVKPFLIQDCVFDFDQVSRDPHTKEPTPTVRLSRSAGNDPATPQRRKTSCGNSNSCPLGKLRASPSKEAIKQLIKTSKEHTADVKNDNNGTKDGVKVATRTPLRRAGMANTLSPCFAKAVLTPVPMETDGDLDRKDSVHDQVMIHVESLLLAEEVQRQTLAVEQIGDVGQK